MPAIDIKRYTPKKPKAKAGKAATTGGLTELLNREITFGNNGLGDKKKESLYAELASLLEAGIDLKSSFDLVTADQKKQADKDLFDSIQRNVINGAAFSKALDESGKFSKYEVFSLQIGEESGKLVEVLKQLAAYFQNKIKQRRKIISALTYPCIVMLTSLGAVFFMLKFIVPMFGDIFKRFGGELPWITRQVISFSNLLSDYFVLFVLLLTTVIAIIISQRKSPAFRKLASAVVLKLPIVGALVQKIYLARFCNSMKLLINAKLPLLQAVSLCRQMIQYYPIETSLLKVEGDIMGGRPLNKSLSDFNIYPSKMIQLIKVGEETNQMDHFFGRIADQYIEEVEYKTATLSSVMEPFIIIFLGLIVGIILISMYLPLLQMSNSFQ